MEEMTIGEERLATQKRSKNRNCRRKIVYFLKFRALQ